MARTPIIPEDTNKRKFIIWQQMNLTVVDFAVLALFVGSGIITALMLWDSGGGLRILGVFIAVGLSALGFFLNKTSSFHNKKIYAVIFEGFINLFINKKYKFNTSNNTTNLVPYEKIEDEFILLKNKSYLTMIKVDGNAFFDFEPIKQEEILEKIWEIYKFVANEKSGGCLIKIDEIKSRKDTIFFLHEKRHEWEQKRKNNLINDKQYFSRIRLLEKEIEKYSNPDLQRIYEWIEKSIYFCFYSTDKEKLRILENTVIDKFKFANLNAYKIDVVKKINTLNKLFDLEMLDDVESNIFQYNEKLEEYFAYDKLEIKPTFLKADNNLRIAIGSVQNYWVKPDLGWIGQIFNIFSPVIINFQKVNEKAFQETLAKAKRNAITAANTTSKKEILTAKKREQEVQYLEEFADIIGYGLDELYKFNIYIVNKGIGQKGLKEAIKDSKTVLKTMGLSLFANPYKQIEAFSGALPKPIDPLMDLIGREIPLFSLVWGMPYINNGLNDQNGWFIANSTMGDELFFNSHIRNDERRNANMFFTATTGAGKSTTMQRMLKNEILNGNKVYIIDPENEYSKFADYFGESKIFLGDGLYKINPMQIMPSLTNLQNEEELEKIKYNKQFWNIDKDKLIDLEFNQNEHLILGHQSIIEILFKTFYKDISEEDIRYLKNQFWFFYNYWFEVKMNKKNILDWSNSEFPILQDFYVWILEKEDSKNALWHKLLELLEDGFVSSIRESKKGTYSMFYNGYTTIEITNNYLTIFDMSSLKDGADSRLLSMQMFLVIKLLEKQVKINHAIDSNVPQRVIVDEAHLLIDKEFPLALDFIYRMVKMIRKRNGGITIITQNPEDFIAEPEIEKKTKAILNNSQYAFIMKSTEANINKLEELYADSDGFTEQEKRYLVTAYAGSGMLMVSNSRRFTLSMDVQKDDFDIIAGNESSLKEWTLNYLTTRLFNLIQGLKYVDLSIKNCIFVDKTSNKKELVINLRNNHKIRAELFKNNIEIEEVNLNNNKLIFNFKELHKEIGFKFYDKISRKLEIIEEKKNSIIEKKYE